MKTVLLPRMDVHMHSGLLAISLVAVCAAPVTSQTRSASTIAADRSKASSNAFSRKGSYDKLPISFEPNIGQTDPDVKFVAHGNAFTLGLTPTEARFALLTPQQKPVASTLKAHLGVSHVARAAAQLRMHLLGASANATVAGREPLPGKVNYLFGRDPKAWKTDVQTYRQVYYRGVYPGVDLVYYGDQRQLEYDFIVAPRVNPGKIVLKFDGANSVKVAKSGDLLVGMNGSLARWHKPIVYQRLNGVRKSVASRFVLKGPKQVGFEVAEYDSHRPLVIDPVFAYSTFLGGSADDSATGIAIDHDGNAYITGQTASNNFPGTAGSNISTVGFVTKIDPTGSSLVYSTYIGEALAKAIAVDSAGQAYVVGDTRSTSIPIVNSLQKTYNGGGTDGFLFKINSNGNGLLYSTYWGGSDFDYIQGIAVSPNGKAYLTGYTQSTNLMVRNAFRSTASGGIDAYLACIDTTKSGSDSLIFATYIGGSGDDAGLGVAVDSASRVYIAGLTTSANFPTASAFQSTLKGQQNAFLSVFSADGTQLSYSTYLGGSGFDLANGIAIDSTRHAYIAGNTSSSDFPVRNAIVPNYGGGGDAFVAKFDCTAVGNTSLLYSTYIGANHADSASAIAVDVWGNAYITGYTYNFASPDNDSAYLVKLGVNGSLLYSTSFGGATIDVGNSIAVDPLGFAFIAGTTTSVDYPISSGAFQKQNGGHQDVFVCRLPTFTKLDFNGDSMPDLLFQNTSDFRLVDWLMRGDQNIGINFLVPANPGANWNLVATADLNGDGFTDLLLQNSATGDLIYWFMNGGAHTAVDFITPKNPGANWNVVGMADFNRDGYPDILFQNSSTSDLYVWYMRGTTMIGAGPINPGNPGTGWKVVATGDLNNDGQADIVFQNATTGNIYVWYLHGDTMIQGGFTNPANPGAGLNVAGLADLTGDGQPEILFQNKDTGALTYWIMNGLNRTSVGTPNPSNPGGAVWKLVGSN